MSEWWAIGRAAKFLGISRSSLRRLALTRKFSMFQTPGGHRRFLSSQLEQYMDKTSSPPRPPSRGATSLGPHGEALGEAAPLKGKVRVEKPSPSPASKKGGFLGPEEVQRQRAGGPARGERSSVVERTLNVRPATRRSHTVSWVTSKGDKREIRVKDENGHPLPNITALCVLLCLIEFRMGEDYLPVLKAFNFKLGDKTITQILDESKALPWEEFLLSLSPAGSPYQAPDLEMADEAEMGGEEYEEEEVEEEYQADTEE